MQNMAAVNQQSNAQSDRTTVKSPTEPRSERELKIKATIEHAKQCIVKHMRKQILTGQNGL